MNLQIIELSNSSVSCICLETTSTHPVILLKTDKVTLWNPKFKKVCVGLNIVDVVPSPKSQNTL